VAATAIASTLITGIIGTADPAEVAMDPVNGNVITNTGQTLILVDNTDSAAHWVTFKTALMEQGLAVKNERVSVAAATKQWFTNFTTAVFGSQLQVGVDAALIPAPAPVPSTATSGGTVLAGVYGVQVTYTNLYGETVASVNGPVTTTGSTSTITVPSPPTVTDAIGWYAYVTQVGGTTFTRQQTAGAPTALGTPLVLTAPPSSGGSVAPAGTVLVKLKVIEP
jgi:hypothetical protein